MERDRQGDRGRRDGFTHEDRQLLNNVHADVHHIRRDFRDAIEKSQTAIMNRLSLIEAKVDRLTPAPGGEIVTDQDKALMAESLVRMGKVVAAANALDELTP